MLGKKEIAHKNTCGVATAGSTDEGSPEGVSRVGASELHHKEIKGWE